MSRKKKLQKKIAVAVSVVNLLNMGAPMVLPYVNVAGQVPAAGGQIVQFADTAQSVLYGTAHAENYTIPPDSTVDVMNADDTMNVNNGGTGTVTTMTGGVQNVHSGGTGTVVTMSGGTQIINNGGTGTVTTMTGGGQIVSSGGTGTVSSLQNGGTQIVYNGGMAISTTIDNGGTQSVLSGGTATDTTLKNKGKQIVSSGGVASGGTFSGVNTNTRGYQEVFEGGTVVGAIFSAYGNQTVTGGMARDTTVTSGGIQAITNKGVSLNAAIKSGGTQSATEGGILAGTQTIEAGASASGGTLKEITVEGKTFKGVQNVNSGGTANNITVTGGGTQFVLSGGRANGVTLDGGTLSMAGRAIASGTVGGHGKVVYDGGSGQIPLGGTNNFSSFTVSGGTLETQNGFQINSSGGITVNSGGTLIAGGAVTVQTSGSSLTVSGGGTFSATNISAENGGEVSMSGGVLQAAGDITIRHALTNAYGDVCAGGTLTVGAGATHPTDKELNLSAGKNINADGQVVSATNISAGGAIAAGSITAANVIADGSISASANISADAISAGDTVSAGGNLTAGTLALSAVPASGAAVSAVGDVNVTDLNVSDFNPAQNTNGSLISAGGTVSAKTVNGKSLTAGSTVDTNVKQAQPKAGIDATFDSLSVSLAADQKTLTYDAHNTYKDIAFSTVTWNTGSAYYDAAASDRFNDNTSISAEKLSFTFAEESQKASLASGSTMTLFANATGLPAGMAVNYGSGKTSVAQEVSYSAPNGVALGATLTGTVATVAGAAVTSETTTSEETTGTIKYTASSMTLDSVELAGWDGVASSAVPSGWTAKSGTAVTVYTDNMNNLPELEAGTSRDILTASAGYFSSDKIEGANKFGNGDAFNEKLNGVAVTGHKLGGIKDTNNGAALTYFAMKKNVENITLGEMTFTDGGTAATLTGVYDATGATLNADSLIFSKDSRTTMEPGNTMTIVDATGAIKNAKGESLKALDAGIKTNFTYNFTDAVADKGITFTGTHTDTLSLDAAKAKLTYTVGVKNVDTSTMTGEIVWNNGDAHYKNTKYNFSADAVTSLKGLTFAAVTADPWGQSMTLIGGDVAGTVTGAPESFGVSVDQANTTLAATASGSASVEDSSVKYAVTGVTLDKVTVKGAGGTADKVPEHWTPAKDESGNVTATIETDGMTVPTVDPEKHMDILQSDTDNFFADVQINGANAYKTAEFTETDGGITFTGSQSRGVTLNTEKNHIIYAVGTKNVSTAALTGEIVWNNGGVYYKNTKYRFNTDAVTSLKGLTFAAVTADPWGQSMTLIGGDVAGTVTGAPESFGVSVDQANTTLAATASGSASVEDSSVKYAVTGVTLDKVTVKGAGGTADKVPEQWMLAKDGSGDVTATIETDGMSVPEVEAGKHKDILQSDTDNFFAGVQINGANAYKTTPFTEQDTAQSMTVAGTQSKGVTLNSEKKHIIYAVSTKDVNTVTLGKVDFVKDAVLLDRSGAEYNYATVTALGTDGFNVAYAAPETVTAGESMTLLKANETLKDMAAQTKETAYSFAPLSGVTIDANITGSLTTSKGMVTYTPSANQASKVTFGSLAWDESKPLLTRPANITFAGADVDTSKISFTGVTSLEADKKMTLVADFGDSVGTITGTKYTVGTALEGEGAASLQGSDLIFTTKTGTENITPQEQTHNAVMAMEAGMATLAAGTEHLGNVMDGLGLAANAGADGTSTAASVGGESSRYKTGSHVNTRSWNATVAVGRNHETKKGSLEYGIFGEYGKGSYTLHSDAGRGDGDGHYAGGGLLARWTNKHNVYTETSIRLGRMSDTASDILHDAAGNGYGYDVHANYFGAHVGIGQVTNYRNGRSLNVYGKYFYTRREGVSFEAGADHYDLDSVSSSLLRIGACYGTTVKRWNWYGGLAFEYEFDGKSEGMVSTGGNSAAIRAASVKGGSVRGDIGLRMDATKDNPWKADIAIYGYGGKHRGFGGNVTVAYTF